MDYRDITQKETRNNDHDVIDCCSCKEDISNKNFRRDQTWKISNTSNHKIICEKLKEIIMRICAEKKYENIRFFGQK